MATSSIFTNAVIKKPKKVEAFVNALESSEKAMRDYRTVDNDHSSILRDIEGIRCFMEKRITVK